jgi:hypothetical protein
MGLDDRKRQKKLERRAAKRKERRRELRHAEPQSLAEQITLASSGSVVHCCVQATLTEEGIGGLLISREAPQQRVAFAVLLVDVLCLGIKDAFGNLVSRGEYRQFYEQFSQRHPLIALTPASGRQLVEDALAYAGKFGIGPHADFHRVKGIFAGIEAAGATRRFDFGGEDGKPYFIAGPNDSPYRCRQVIQLLQQHCPAGEFSFLIPAGDGADLDEITAANDHEDAYDAPPLKSPSSMPRLERR